MHAGQQLVRVQLGRGDGLGAVLVLAFARLGIAGPAIGDHHRAESHVAEHELAQRRGLGVVDDLHAAAPDPAATLLGSDRHERLAQRSGSPE